MEDEASQDLVCDYEDDEGEEDDNEDDDEALL